MDNFDESERIHLPYEWFLHFSYPEVGHLFCGIFLQVCFFT